MTQRLQGRRVLIVDDDEDILSSIALAMKAEGAETDTVTDGNSAVSACQKGHPHAVVLDMMLPRRSGFLVLEKILEQAHPPPVIMVTANKGKRHMAYAEAIGVSAYFVKPVPLQRLVDAVVRLVDDDGRPRDATPTPEPAEPADTQEGS